MDQEIPSCLSLLLAEQSSLLSTSWDAQPHRNPRSHRDDPNPSIQHSLTAISMQFPEHGAWGWGRGAGGRTARMWAPQRIAVPRPFSTTQFPCSSWLSHPQRHAWGKPNAAPHKGETERTAVGLETLEGNMKGQRPSPTSPQCQRSRRHLHDKAKPVSIWAGPKGGLPTAFEVGSGASTGGGLRGTDTSTHPPRRGQEFSRDKTPGSGTGYRDRGRGIRQRNRGWDMGTGDRAREQYGCPVPDTGAVHTLCAMQHPEHPNTPCMWHRPRHTAPCMHPEHAVLPVCTH